MINLLNLWLNNVSLTLIKRLSIVSESTKSWNLIKIRKLGTFNKYLNFELQKLAGDKCIVEVDESKFGR